MWFPLICGSEKGKNRIYFASLPRPDAPLCAAKHVIEKKGDVVIYRCQRRHTRKDGVAAMERSNRNIGGVTVIVHFTRHLHLWAQRGQEQAKIPFRRMYGSINTREVIPGMRNERRYLCVYIPLCTTRTGACQAPVGQIYGRINTRGVIPGIRNERRYLCIYNSTVAGVTHVGAVTL